MSQVIVEQEREGRSLRRISWGAIIAGTVLMLVVEVMLGLLGLGIGLATVDPAGGGSPSATTLSSASGIFAAIAVLIATFVGAYAATRLSGVHDARDAVLHGVTTWAVATLVAVYLVTSGVSAVVSSTFGALGSTIQSLGGAAGNLMPESLDALPPELRSQAEQLLARGEDRAQQAAQQVEDQAQDAAQNARQATGEQDLGAAVSEIFAGVRTDATPEERQAAVSAISSQAGIPEAEAEQRLGEFQGRYEEFVAQAQQAAEGAAEAVSGAAFAAFVGMLLGLIVGALGGLVGRSQRVHELYR